MAQAEIVMKAIREYDPLLECRLVTMKTSGDKLLDRPLGEIGGKELFTGELDRLLLDGKLDLCVHSMKDVPIFENPQLPIVAVSAREDPRDALVLPEGVEALAPGAVIGCSSLRRRAQLAQLLPDCPVRPIRGNILTRIAKLDAGEVGALVLAAAGLRRLGLQGRVSRYFSVEELLPAPCQGVLAVQCRKGEDAAFLGDFHSADSWDATLAERCFVKALGGGCNTPMAAYATVKEDTLQLQAMVVGKDGRVYKGVVQGSRGIARQIGAELAVWLAADAGGGIDGRFVPYGQ